MTADDHRVIALEQIRYLKNDLAYWKRVLAIPSSPMHQMAEREMPRVKAEIDRYREIWGLS